jgi:hypothetical protein
VVVLHTVTDFHLGLNAHRWLKIRMRQIADGAGPLVREAAAAEAEAESRHRTRDRDRAGRRGTDTDGTDGARSSDGGKAYTSCSDDSSLLRSQSGVRAAAGGHTTTTGGDIGSISCIDSNDTTDNRSSSRGGGDSGGGRAADIHREGRADGGAIFRLIQGTGLALDPKP